MGMISVFDESRRECPFYNFIAYREYQDGAKEAEREQCDLPNVAHCKYNNCPFMFWLGAFEGMKRLLDEATEEA